MNNKYMWVIGIIIVIIAAVVLFGLSHKTKDIRSNIDPSTMEIKIGEVKSFSEVPNLSLKFLDVSEDSRCPAGYECVHAGWVTVRVEVTLDGVVVTKEISTTGGIKPSEISVGDITIRLVNIKPIRTSPDPVKKSAYEATFTVVLSTAEDSTVAVVGNERVQNDVVDVSTNNTFTCTLFKEISFTYPMVSGWEVISTKEDSEDTKSECFMTLKHPTEISIKKEPRIIVTKVPYGNSDFEIPVEAISNPNPQSVPYLYTKEGSLHEINNYGYVGFYGTGYKYWVTLDGVSSKSGFPVEQFFESVIQSFSIAKDSETTSIEEVQNTPSGIHAKIEDPAPVEEDGIVYSSHLNYVEAKNKETGKTLWKTDVYKSAEPESYDSSLETDVQLNIIRSVRVEGEILFVRDSKGTEYRLKKDTGEAL